MNGYEKLIQVMRKEAERNKNITMCIGEMTGRYTCKVKEMDLDADDLMIAAGLELEAGDEVLVTRVTEDKYIIIAKVVKL